MISKFTKQKTTFIILSVLLLVFALSTSVALGHLPDDDGALHEDSMLNGGERFDPSAPLIALDATLADVVSSGPSANVTKNLAAASHGERNSAGSTTDVWTLGKYAYTGTFSSPCGDPEAGVWVWDVHNANKTSLVGIIPSPGGSRSNDVKVAEMNSGDILVHSNEICGVGGPGGFEIYNVDDPTAPTFLAHVRINESDLNTISPLFFAPGALDDVGVHNLFLFTQGSNDYVAAVSEGVFDNLRIYDITVPTAPVLLSGWGAEQLVPGLPASVDDYSDLTLADDPTGAITLNALLDLFSGFGSSQNKFLHDVTISDDGTKAYLANWDAGLVLLDISDPTDPTLISVALNVDDGSLDGEVNSHSVWPSEDGKIVVEGEEDFAPFHPTFEITSGPNVGSYPASESSFTTPISSLPSGEMSDSTTYVGLACSPVSAGIGIALIQRGACRFDLKATNAINAGYSGMVVFNDAARGDALVTMAGDPRAIPGVFVGHSTGLKIAGVATAVDLVIGASSDVKATTLPDGWSGFRIWDYSDPANPVLASTFNTVCSADPIDPICDPAGTYSSHNVIVETTEEGKVRAYVSWYTDGALILDVTDPYNPVEVARYKVPGESIWGIYKAPDEPWIYASDRNGGLVVLKEFGAGTKGKK